MFNKFFFLYFLVLITSCSNSSETESNTSYLDAGSDNLNEAEILSSNIADDCIKIPYNEKLGNTITIPVKINGLGLDMIYDTGASTTCITLAEARYLYSKGKLNDTDILDFQQFQTADGNITVGLRVNISEVLIGDQIKLNDVQALVVENQQAPLLLGQTILKQFKEISVDRENFVIKFYK